MFAHFLGTAKAYAALIGAVLTAVVGTMDAAPQWLTVAVAVCTAVATYTVPNFDLIEDESDPDNPVIVDLDERDGNLNH